MTPKNPVKHRRLLSIQRRLTAIETRQQEEILQLREELTNLKVARALMAGTIARLIGENDRLRLNARKLGITG
jgi:hypothetical protein